MCVTLLTDLMTCCTGCIMSKGVELCVQIFLHCTNSNRDQSSQYMNTETVNISLKMYDFIF